MGKYNPAFVQVLENVCQSLMPAGRAKFKYPSKNRYLNVGQAAKLIGVSAKTLRRWDKNNILPCIRTKGGQRRYHQKDLTDFKIWKQGGLKVDELQVEKDQSKPPHEPVLPFPPEISEPPALPKNKKLVLLATSIFFLGIIIGRAIFFQTVKQEDDVRVLGQQMTDQSGLQIGQSFLVLPGQTVVDIRNSPQTCSPETEVSENIVCRSNLPGWSRSPQVVSVTPTWETIVWVTNVSETGFTVHFSRSPEKEEKAYWLALW